MEKKALEVFDTLDSIDISSLFSIEEKKEFYDAVIDCFYTLLYTRVPQGRKAAPLSLTLHQTDQLLEGTCASCIHFLNFTHSYLICISACLVGATFSTVLKTGLTFGYQPVAVDEVLKSKLKIVMMKVRPLLRAVMSKEALTDPRGLMIPAWTSTMEVIKRDPVKAWSLKHMGTATTITDVRCMWEMAGGYCHDNGKRYVVCLT